MRQVGNWGMESGRLMVKILPLTSAGLIKNMCVKKMDESLKYMCDF